MADGEKDGFSYVVVKTPSCRDCAYCEIELSGYEMPCADCYVPKLARSYFKPKEAETDA